MHFYQKFVSLLLFICLYANIAYAQVDYSVYANIVYRFTKYIDWPEQYKNGDFIIGVVGESELFDELKKLTKNKRVGNQPIVVKYLSPNAKNYNVHILFISNQESGKLRRIAEITDGKPILLVSEHFSLISKGACINFILVGDNLKLEFGKSNIENRKLNIASELLNLGTIVN
jgi:hypothetical protein